MPVMGPQGAEIRGFGREGGLMSATSLPSRIYQECQECGEEAALGPGWERCGGGVRVNVVVPAM